MRCVPLEKDVPSQTYFEAQVEFESPAKTGHYQIGFQMKFEHAQFGEKVWCDFIVEEPTCQFLIDMEDMLKPVIEQLHQ